MSATNILDTELVSLNIKILETKPSGSRKLHIPANNLDKYFDIIKQSLDNGFWNEVVNAREIIFGFKHKDGSFEKITLNADSEKHISELCTEFNGDPIEKTSNVYKYLSENDFYADVINTNYKDLLNR
jgi:hypothetical protein